jgi:AraC-like DNA-binding protein
VSTQKVLQRLVLLGSNSTVAEAASVAGYDSLSHFSRRFHDTFGCMPSQCRAAGAIPASTEP